MNRLEGVIKKINIFKLTVAVEVADSKTKQSKTCFQKFRDSLSDYFTRSSIHGLTYLTDNRTSFIVRVTWLAFCVMVTYRCALFIKDLNFERNNSIQVSYFDDFASVPPMEFPALTIFDAIADPIEDEVTNTPRIGFSSSSSTLETVYRTEL